MNGSMESYDEVDAVESFDDFESTEAASPFRPGRRLSAPGGLSKATLHMAGRPPATLQMPARVATDRQLQTVVQALNVNTQRLNGFQTQLRQLSVRPRDPQGQSTLSLFLLMKLQKDLQEHIHAGGAKPTFPTASGGGFSALLPMILLLQPGLFGQFTAGGSSSTQSSGTPDMMMILVLMNLLP